MEFWKSGLLNDFALAVAVNRFLTEPIKIQQILEEDGDEVTTRPQLVSATAETLDVVLAEVK